MGRALDKHRIKNRQAASEVLGDADTTNMVANLLAELGTKGAAIEADKQKSDAAAAAAKKLALGNAPAVAAAQAAKDADKAAYNAQAEALAEADPKGPKHLFAQQMALAAKVADAKAAYYQQGGTSQAGADAAALKAHLQAQGGSESMLTPRNILIAAIVGGGGFLLYKKLKK